jgi:hypothetical protein
MRGFDEIDGSSADAREQIARDPSALQIASRAERAAARVEIG